MGIETLSVDATRRKVVYREGDTVRIINSRFIKRVGYPIVWTDLIDEFQTHPKIHEAAALLGVVVTRDFVVGAAKAAVRARGFGGRERSIHYHRTVPDGEIYTSTDGRPDYTGRTALVYSKFTRMTGTYFAPGGYEDDYDPGGLDNQKTHVILRTNLGDIEVCDVELVRAAS